MMRFQIVASQDSMQSQTLCYTGLARTRRFLRLNYVLPMRLLHMLQNVIIAHLVRNSSALRGASADINVCRARTSTQGPFMSVSNTVYQII